MCRHPDNITMQQKVTLHGSMKVIDKMIFGTKYRFSLFFEPPNYGDSKEYMQFTFWAKTLITLQIHFLL